MIEIKDNEDFDRVFKHHNHSRMNYVNIVKQ